MLTDPRYYNIRWLELLSELTPADRPVPGRAVSAERVLITGGGGQLASDLEAQLAAAARRFSRRPAPSSTSPTTPPSRAVVRRAARRRVVSTAPRSTTWRSASARRTARSRSTRARSSASRRAAPRPARGFVHLSTNYVFDGTAAEPYDEDALPNPRSIYAISKLAGEHAALAYAPGALVVRTAGLYGLHGSASKGGNFVTRMIARASEQGALKVVADQRLTPTFTADLAAGILAARRRRRHGHAAPDQLRRDELARVHRGDHGAGRRRRARRARRPPCARPARPTARSTACCAPRSPSEPGWRRCGPGDDALADYLERAGLLAAAPRDRTAQHAR